MNLWLFLPVGYLATILIETPVLLAGLPRKLNVWQRLACGVWLTACTYPVVVLVLPNLLGDYSRTFYLLVAEIFAPVAECVLFWLAFGRRLELNQVETIQSFAAIIMANLASFLIGEVLNAYRWFGLF